MYVDQDRNQAATRLLVAADDGLSGEGIVCGGGESHVSRIPPHARAHIRRLHPNRVGVTTACGTAAGSI